MAFPVAGRWLLVLLLLGACAAPAPRRQDWRPEQGIEALLRGSAARLDSLQDLTAEAEIVLRQGRQRERGTALIQLRNPDMLRVEVRGPFYSHILTALLQGDSLTVHGPAVGGVWKGAARGPLLARLTGLDLGLYDLRLALLGLVQPAPLPPREEYEFPRADRAVVPLSQDGLVRRVWVDLHRGFVLREEVALAGGQMLWSRELKNYRRVGSLYLPERVEISQEEVAIALDYRSWKLDQGVSAERLLQGLPKEGVRRLP